MRPVNRAAPRAVVLVALFSLAACTAPAAEPASPTSAASDTSSPTSPTPEPSPTEANLDGTIFFYDFFDEGLGV